MISISFSRISFTKSCFAFRVTLKSPKWLKTISWAQQSWSSMRRRHVGLCHSMAFVCSPLHSAIFLIRPSRFTSRSGRSIFVIAIDWRASILIIKVGNNFATFSWNNEFFLLKESSACACCLRSFCRLMNLVCGLISVNFKYSRE